MRPFLPAIRVQAVLGMLGIVLLPGMLAAQTTEPTAASYVVGQGWLKFQSPGHAQGAKFYRFGVVAGRSYCVEQVGSDFVADKADTVSYVSRPGGGGDIVGNNDDMATEPGAVPASTQPSRFCWIAPATEAEFLQLFTKENGVSFERKFRVMDTTLFAPWFFSGSGFEAFVLLKNTTNQAISTTVTLYSTAGASLGSQTAVVPANGSYNLQVSAAPPTGFGIPNATGTVQISHLGAPGALLGNVTSLSFGQGVSFDTVVAPRTDWQ